MQEGLDFICHTADSITNGTNTAFDAVPIELEKRASKLGRLDKASALHSKYVPTDFLMGTAEKELPNPVKQAEYLYSLIRPEAITNGTK